MVSRNPTTALLVSTDASLTETVRGVIGSIGNLGLTVMPGIAEASSDLARDHLALVLVHQECAGSVDATTRLLRIIAEAKRPLPTLALSDRHRAEQALALLRAGVADYLSRPLDLSRLTYLIDVLTLRSRLTRSTFASVAARQPAPIPPPGDDDLGLSPPVTSMERMMDQIRRVASQDTTILLGGETGTGKTRLARLIHGISPRRAALPGGQLRRPLDDPDRK